MAHSEALKARGNAAFAAGNAAAAAALYSEALDTLEPGGAEALRGDVLCNRAAARTQLKEYAAALADAEAAAAAYAAAAAPAREAKAWARAAAAHSGLGSAVAAAAALRRAAELDGAPQRCEAYAEALCAIPARPVETAAIRRHAPARLGDIASPAPPEALPLLLAAATARGAKWALPRLAAAAQLAALAACPVLRPQFLAPGAGLAALAAWASDDTLTRLPLPAAVRAAWAAALREKYERSSLLLPAAAGFAAVTHHASAEAGGGARGAASGAVALLEQPLALRALCDLAARTPRCAASQHAVAEALRACLRAAEPAAAGSASEKRLLALLDAGAETALMMLARNFRDADDKPRADATNMVLDKLRRHPMHPQMRVPDDV